MCSDHDCPDVRQGHAEINVQPSTVSRAAIVYHTLELWLAGLQSTSNQQTLFKCRLAVAPAADSQLPDFTSFQIQTLVAWPQVFFFSTHAVMQCPQPQCPGSPLCSGISAYMPSGT